MRKQWKKISVLAAALVVAVGLVFAVAPTTSQAASTKKVTANANYKKAPKLKVGNNLVTNKKTNHYVKFTAPSKGTYVITFSQIKSVPSPKNEMNLGNIYVREMVTNVTYPYMTLRKVKTNGGSNSTLFLATKYSYNRFYRNQKVTINSYLYTRKATVSLKKGKTLYFSSYFTNGGKKYSYKVTIKKKK